MERVADLLPVESPPARHCDYPKYLLEPGAKGIERSDALELRINFAILGELVPPGEVSGGSCLLIRTDRHGRSATCGWM